MPHVENYDLGVCRIDRVKDQIWIAYRWEHADARLVSKMTSLRKILEQAGYCRDALNHSNCGCSIAFVNIGEYVIDVRKCALGPAHFHAL